MVLKLIVTSTPVFKHTAFIASSYQRAEMFMAVMFDFRGEKNFVSENSTPTRWAGTGEFAYFAL